jgi:TetR/AcrR family transcriptional regulator
VATQKRLLRAAEREFAAHGYQGARLKSIAKRASVQPALIHHYYDGKEGLYRAMLEAALIESSNLSFDILARVEPAATSFREVVDGFAGMLLAFNRKYEDLISILRHESRGTSVATAMTRAIIRERVLPIVEAVGAYVTRQQALGVVRRDVHADEMVYALMAQCAYPFVDAGFLEACMPRGLISDDASMQRRRQMATEVVLAFCLAKPGFIAGEPDGPPG